MATKETSQLAKRASETDNHKQCLLVRGNESQVAWLPDSIRVGQAVTIEGLIWTISEVY